MSQIHFHPLVLLREPNPLNEKSYATLFGFGGGRLGCVFMLFILFSNGLIIRHFATYDAPNFLVQMF